MTPSAAPASAPMVQSISTIEVSAIAERLEAVRENIVRQQRTLEGIEQSLRTLARVEQEQTNIGTRLREGSERMSALDTRLTALERALPDHAEDRLDAIELQMPGLAEIRRWVVGGVIAVVGLVGTAVVKLVIVDAGPRGHMEQIQQQLEALKQRLPTNTPTR